MKTKLDKGTQLDTTKFGQRGNSGQRSTSKIQLHPYLRPDFLEIHPHLALLAAKIASR